MPGQIISASTDLIIIVKLRKLANQEYVRNPSKRADSKTERELNS